MKPTVLLGAASALMRSKKLKIVFVALQLGYLTYKLLEKNPEEEHEELAQ
ncbi:hypothetical protein [Formosa sp. PL04]|nr:hypothetical protein [Formosa sp. PL04]MDW5288299.1 hypothetical protein [Formosa sp. PL04]